MKQKRQVPYHQYIISLVCVAFLAGSGSYIYFNQRVKNMESETSEIDLSKVSQLYNEINENYVGEVDKNELINGALKGMTEALDDPYSSYLSGTDADELNETISGSFEGIGAVMSLKDELPTVVEAPVADSPADKAGIKSGDILLKVDGKETAGQTLADVVSQVRGKKGTEVKLTFQRGTEIFDVKVKRDTIPIETVYPEIDKENPTIGKIKITSFSENTYEDTKKAIKKLRKEGATSFVIDLRQNPGGLLDQVEKMASMFLKDGKTIVQFEDNSGNKTVDKASKELDGGFKVTEPTVVIVDDGSASASEIFAAALKESAGAPVIGMKTYGKGTVQTVKNLNDNTELKLTVMKWLTPKGTWINEKGVKPTISLSYPDYYYLNPISREKELKLGDQSSVVKNLNQILHALGYDVEKESEEFSDRTQKAVQDVQTKNELEPTGSVDEKTAGAIETELLNKMNDEDLFYDKAVETLQDKGKD